MFDCSGGGVALKFFSDMKGVFYDKRPVQSGMRKDICRSGAGYFPDYDVRKLFWNQRRKNDDVHDSRSGGVLPILFCKYSFRGYMEGIQGAGRHTGNAVADVRCDWGMLLFMVTCLVSTLGSGYPEASWTGFEVGIRAMMLAYGGMHWMITRYYEPKDGIWVVFYRGGAAACLLAILQHFE